MSSPGGATSTATPSGRRSGLEVATAMERPVAGAVRSAAPRPTLDVGEDPRSTLLGGATAPQRLTLAIATH
jgi:hypothetical protein